MHITCYATISVICWHVDCKWHKLSWWGRRDVEGGEGEGSLADGKLVETGSQGTLSNKPV